MLSTRITSVSLDGFRNLRNVQFAPAPNANVFIGPNGAGKTSLLEAIDYVATLRSFRGGTRETVIAHDAERASLAMRVDAGSVPHEFRVVLGRGSRESEVDGKRPTHAIGWYGIASCVVFQPQDLEIVRGAPDIRRRYLDRMLVRCVDGYGEWLRTYTRALKSRNAVLRGDSSDARAVRAYDAMLATTGAHIVAERTRAARDLVELVQTGAGQLGFGEHGLTARYVSRAPEDESEFAVALTRSYANDVLRRTTTLGPHGDDVRIEFDGRPARSVASQGQTRAIALALRLAEIQLLRQRSSGRTPFLLLDDVSSELDRDHTNRLFALVDQLSAHVWMTTTDPAIAALLPRAKLWNVDAGAVTPT